jgi:hypothetical protein
MVRPRVASSSVVLSRWSDVFKEAALASTERSKITTRLNEAEIAVRAAAHLAGVLIILAVVLPETNMTNVEAAALAQRAIPAAWATIRSAVLCRTLDDTLHGHDV